MNIYVGNLSFKVTENDLKVAFEEYGNVDSVKLISDKYTGQSKGFGFVVMETKMKDQGHPESERKELDNREITVNEARPKRDNFFRGNN